MRARMVAVDLLAGAVRRANQERCRPALNDNELKAIIKSVQTYEPGRRAT
jgi:hypothetical protein